MILETALDQKLTEHLGQERNGPVVNEAGDVRNGARPKMVLIESAGEVQLDVPRACCATPGAPLSPSASRRRVKSARGPGTAAIA
jgi:hypothetical protein